MTLPDANFIFQLKEKILNPIAAATSGGHESGKFGVSMYHFPI